MSDLLDRLRRWWSCYSGPHHCRSCGEPMSYGHNDAGRWAVLCPRMWLSLGDDYLLYNNAGHSKEVTETKPNFGDCGHEHEERSLLRGYPI